MSSIEITGSRVTDSGLVVTVELRSTEPTDQTFDVEVNAINGEQRSERFGVVVPSARATTFDVTFDTLSADGESVLVTANLLDPVSAADQAEVPTAAATLESVAIESCTIRSFGSTLGGWKVGDTGEVEATIRNDHPFEITLVQSFTANGTPIGQGDGITTRAANPAGLPVPARSSTPTAITFEITEAGRYEIGVVVDEPAARLL